MQEWSSKNKMSERYNWYSTFKAAFGLEDYLNNIDIKKFRDSLIRFRLSINDLAVNRWDNSTIELKCPFCNQRDDEEHLLLECEMYNYLRQKYLCRNDQEFNKRLCMSWMKGGDRRRSRALAMFIYYAMKLRNVHTES